MIYIAANIVCAEIANASGGSFPLLLTLPHNEEKYSNLSNKKVLVSKRGSQELNSVCRMFEYALVFSSSI